ncbi:hypothetical protein BE18_06975 [Sorangium cellulosum]|uniref:Uncharacterized protein n=1 Tax=Sorangium cellulosum TaxID=56 RepID=A0A150RNZ3_SORCE|nr:hypothetical protein BE18_06975 [Sorangium cellulosum]
MSTVSPARSPENQRLKANPPVRRASFDRMYELGVSCPAMASRPVDGEKDTSSAIWTSATGDSGGIWRVEIPRRATSKVFPKVTVASAKESTTVKLVKLRPAASQ